MARCDTHNKYVVALTGQDVGPGFKPKRELVEAACEYDAVKAVVALHADDITASKSTWIIFCGLAHAGAASVDTSFTSFSLGRVACVDAKDAPLVLEWPLNSNSREVMKNREVIENAGA